MSFWERLLGLRVHSGAAATPSPPPAPPRYRRRPGPRPPVRSTMPMPLTSLVRVSRVDVAEELRRRFCAGAQDVCIGLGEDVDVRLLEDDLVAAHVRPIDRELHICTVSHEGKGRMALVRTETNFGVFYAPRDEPGAWSSVQRWQTIERLRPGDRIGLGSCPGDALVFLLPELHGAKLSGSGAGRSFHYEAMVRVALTAWRYGRITVGGGSGAVVRLPDPELADLRLVLLRNLGAPSRGYGLMLLNPGPGVWLRAAGERVFRPLQAGARLRLSGPGNRLRLGRHELLLPTPVLPRVRFGGRSKPTPEDLAQVFNLELEDLRQPERIRERYRELVRLLHPDRNGEDPGHLSRFLEVQACWQAHQERMC